MRKKSKFHILKVGSWQGDVFKFWSQKHFLRQNSMWPLHDTITFYQIWGPGLRCGASAPICPTKFYSLVSNPYSPKLGSFSQILFRFRNLANVPKNLTPNNSIIWRNDLWNFSISAQFNNDIKLKNTYQEHQFSNFFRTNHSEINMLEVSHTL